MSMLADYLLRVLSKGREDEGLQEGEGGARGVSPQVPLKQQQQQQHPQHVHTLLHSRILG